MNKRRIALIIVIVFGASAICVILYQRKPNLNITWLNDSIIMINGSRINNLSKIDLSQEKWSGVPILRVQEDANFNFVQNVIQQLVSYKWTNIMIYIGAENAIMNFPLKISEDNIEFIQDGKKVSVTSNRVTGILVKTGRSITSEVSSDVLCFALDSSTPLKKFIKLSRENVSKYKYSYVYINWRIFSDESFNVEQWRGVAIIPKDILEKAGG